MATGNFYRGTSLNQDSRFSNKDKKLMNSITWPEEFDKPVNIKKVDLSIIKHWIKNRITELLGLEDDVLINFAITELEAGPDNNPCPKKMCMFLTGFLGKNTLKFMKELWNLLLEAEISPNGIPASLIEEKIDELLHKKEQMQLQVSKLQNIQKNLEKAEPSKPSAFHSSGNKQILLREETLASKNSKSEDSKIENKDQAEKKARREESERKDGKSKFSHFSHRGRDKEESLGAERQSRRKSDDKGRRRAKETKRKESSSSSDERDDSSKDSRRKKNRKPSKKGRDRSSSSSDSSVDNKKKRGKRKSSSSSESSSSSSASIRLKTKKPEGGRANAAKDTSESKKEKKKRSRSRDNSKSRAQKQQAKEKEIKSSRDKREMDKKKEEKKRKPSSSSDSDSSDESSDW